MAGWLESRTGLQSALKHLLDEPLPGGVGWWFTTGSILLALLSIQLLTGIALAIYYVPSPDYAYDSVRFIMEQVTFGRVLRGLHFFGASFIVIAAVVHMLRVVIFGSYKKPRDANWLVGVLLFLVILAFALTGYLLPWDQKAYWATTVTINIARTAPLGGFVSRLMMGGNELGALTLLRWYAVHVFLLPASLIGFTVAHLYLMRRQGISGPIKPDTGPTKPFYPDHALKDTVVVAVVFALLLTMAAIFKAPLDAVADPTDASYIPRPEWYFMSLFELLKHFPGPLEPIATMVIPGLLFAALLLLPYLDRSTSRSPSARPLVMGGFAFVGLAVVLLTYRGFATTRPMPDPAQWGLMPIAGREFAHDEKCMKCHNEGGVANPIELIRPHRDPDWLMGHVRDPEIIAVGIRTPPRGAGVSESQARAIVGYVQKIRAGSPPPVVSAQMSRAADVFGRSCGLCHRIDGDGGTSGPDLSRAGEKRDAAWLHRWIGDPESVDPKASMPGFGGMLDDDQMSAVVDYLAARK